MQAIPYEEFIRVMRLNPLPSLSAIHNQAFRELSIPEWFEGWELDHPSGRLVDRSENCNVVWFNHGELLINGKKLPYPTTLNQFILSCRKEGVRLIWQDDMADEIWSTVTDLRCRLYQT